MWCGGTPSLPDLQDLVSLILAKSSSVYLCKAFGGTSFELWCVRAPYFFRVPLFISHHTFSKKLAMGPFVYVKSCKRRNFLTTFLQLLWLNGSCHNTVHIFWHYPNGKNDSSSPQSLQCKSAHQEMQIFFKSCCSSSDLNATVAKEGIKWVVPLSIELHFGGSTTLVLPSSWFCLALCLARARAIVETWEGILKSCWAHNLRDSTIESRVLLSCPFYNNKKAAEVL